MAEKNFDNYWWDLKLKEQMGIKQNEINCLREQLKDMQNRCKEILKLKKNFLDSKGEYCSLLNYWTKDLNKIFEFANQYIK